MEAKLCWVNIGNGTRELELWIGPRKICGFKDIQDMDALEKIVGDGEGSNQKLRKQVEDLEE